MGDTSKKGAPLEFFLWRRGNGSTPSLSTEKTVQGHNGEEGLIGDALRVFNARTRTVRRSSGGLSVAEPYQIVFFDPQEKEKKGNHKPEVRIKVRFRDFKHGHDGELTRGDTVTHTKVVLPSELGEAFSFDLENPKGQSYVADFGYGIAPVYVIEFRREAGGGNSAYFIEAEDLARLTRRTAGEVQVQLYRMDRDLLRQADTKRRSGKSEWDVAQENYSHRLQSGRPTVPRELAVGKVLSISTGRTPKEIRDTLRPYTGPVEEKAASASRSVTGEMIPFGLFES